MLCGKRCVVNFIATCYNKSYRQHQFERSASMKNLSIPVGISDFEEIRRKGYYYVDKSMLIAKLLKDEGTKVTLITRPRRFGKTLGMSMLANFLEVRKDSRDIFEGLEIAG